MVHLRELEEFTKDIFGLTTEIRVDADGGSYERSLLAWNAMMDELKFYLIKWGFDVQQEVVSENGTVYGFKCDGDFLAGDVWEKIPEPEDLDIQPKRRMRDDYTYNMEWPGTKLTLLTPDKDIDIFGVNDDRWKIFFNPGKGFYRLEHNHH